MLSYETWLLILALFVFPLFLWSCLFTEPLALKEILFEVELLAKSLLKFNITNEMCIFLCARKISPPLFLHKNSWYWKKFCLKLSFAKKSSSSILQITCAFFLQKENFTHIFCPQTFLPKSKREVKSKNVTNKVSYRKVSNFKNPAISNIFWCWHFGTKVSTPLFKETFQLGSTQYIKVFNFSRY